MEIAISSMQSSIGPKFHQLRISGKIVTETFQQYKDEFSLVLFPDPTLNSQAGKDSGRHQVLRCMGFSILCD